MIIVTSLFLKMSVFNVFSVHTKTKSRPFQIPPVERAFWKAPFSWRISLTVEIKPAFSNSSRLKSFQCVFCSHQNEKPGFCFRKLRFRDGLV